MAMSFTVDPGISWAYCPPSEKAAAIKAQILAEARAKGCLVQDLPAKKGSDYNVPDFTVKDPGPAVQSSASSKKNTTTQDRLHPDNIRNTRRAQAQGADDASFHSDSDTLFSTGDSVRDAPGSTPEIQGMENAEGEGSNKKKGLRQRVGDRMRRMRSSYHESPHSGGAAVSALGSVSLS